MIGSGGMGEVYEAEHELLGTRRALKVLAHVHGDQSRMAERMRVEARALAKLRHPSLVEVLDLGVSEGRWFFAMALLEGHTVRELQHAHADALTWDVATRIACAVLEGLHAAHRIGLVHRDVKPENVFVCDDGAVKVLDFGIAKVADAASITQSGSTVGTPRYMAPEQIEGKEVDARTDVYSVGVMLYELLCGQPPFGETETIALAYAHVTRPAPPLTEGSKAPERVALAVSRALAKKPADRFPSALAFREELEACLSPEERSPAPTQTPLEGKFPKRARAEETPAPPTRTPSSDADVRSARTRTMQEGDLAPPSHATEALASSTVNTSEPVAMRLAALSASGRWRRVGVLALAAAGIVGIAAVAKVRTRTAPPPLATSAQPSAAATGVTSDVRTDVAPAPVASAIPSATSATSQVAPAPAASAIPSAARATHAPSAAPKPRRAERDAGGRALREDDPLILDLPTNR